MVNGHPKQVLGPNGTPWRQNSVPFDSEYSPEGVAVPHVYTFASMMGTAWKTYMLDRWDEAMRFGRDDAREMMNDAWLMGLMQERMLGVSSLKWHLEVDDERDPEQKSMKDGLTKIINCTPRLQELKHYMLWATWYGRYGSHVTYEWKHMRLPSPGSSKSEPDPNNPQGTSGVLESNSEVKRALTMTRHQPVSGDKIGHKYNGVPYILIQPTIASNFATEQIVRDSVGTGLLLEGRLRERFIIHRHMVMDADFFNMEQAEAVHGFGIRSVVFWLNWLRQEWLANVATWVERTGLGVRLWYYQGGNPRSKSEVAQAAKDQSDKVNILIPRYGEKAVEGVEYVDTSSAGAEVMVKLMEHVQEMIERYVIGQRLSGGSEVHSLGGTGVASLDADTKRKITNFDAVNLAETLTQDFLKVIQRWTYPELRDVPCHWVFEVDQQDPAKIMQAAAAIVAMGAEIREDDIRATAGFAAPRPGDKVLKAPTMIAGMPGMPPGAPGGQPPEQGQGGQQDDFMKSLPPEDQELANELFGKAA